MRLLRPAAAMDSLRKWFYKPKRDDRSLLAQFFFADEALNMVAAELDSFDGRENPERCSTLVNQLRHAQERVLNITGQIMDQFLGNERVPRGFRVKFPEEVLQDNLAGQLWFGAECLAAGSSIMHREEESTAMRPLARALTRTLETVRSLLREHCLRYNRYGSPPPHACTEILHESLKIFDRLFAEFELCYVSAMVPVKTPQEFEVQQLICVLFSETLQRARRIGLLTQDQVDDYDPALMFAIPRLAIVSGLLIFSNGPLSIDKSPELMSDMFRPFRTLLHKIRELLWTLDRRELYLLEKLLCTNEDIANIRSNVDISNEGSVPFNLDAGCYPDISEFVTRFYSDNSHCKDMLNQIGCEWGNIQNENLQMSTLQGCDEERNPLITDADYLPENVEIFSPILDGMLRLNEVVSPNDNNESPLEAFCDARLIVENGNFDKSSPDEKPRIEPTHISDEVLVTDAFHSQEENNVKLNIEYVDTDICDNINTKESDNDKSQENSTLSISKSERRNSNRSLGSSRKSSRNESISSSHASDYLTRNLSSNGLSMFDPLAGASFSTVNINPTASDNNVLLPDQNLVSNLSEQVSEITDKLTSITLGDGENASENNMNISHIDPSIVNLLNDQVSGQIFSFSSNDVSNLVSSGIDPEFSNVSNNVTYSPSRTDKVMSQTSMPSTSNGYLIRNAISQEPAIMASLSTNNSGMYNDESILNPINNPLLMGQTSNYMNMESDLFTDSFSVANANLSCLLLTNEEFHSTFLTQGIDQNSEDHDTPIPQDLTFTFAQCDDSTYFSANDETLSPNQVPSTSQNNTSEKAQFLVGYESDSNDQTPADSGICTENTSLDRSPDSEIKDIDAKTGNKPNSNYQLNKTKNNIEESKDNFSTNNSTEFDSKSQVDLSITPNNNENVSECDNTNFEINSFCLNYCEDTESNQKNEAGPSHRDIQEPAFVQTQKFNTAKISDASSSFSPLLDENSDIDNHPDSYDNINNNKCDSNICNDNLSNNNENEISTTPSREDSSDKSQNPIDESQNNPSVVTDDIQTSANETHFGASQISEQSSSTNSTGVVVQRKLRKTSPKNKKKSGKSRFSVFHQSEPKIPWSPGRVVLHNRSYVENKTPMRLNLEQLVDDCAGGSCSSQSSATSSFHSDWADDEEIALALQAQEFASRHQTRAKFRSSEDLIHRLFVCIAGVADQLQTNFASDLRNILKSVFLMNQTPEIEPEKVEENSEEANNDNEAEESPSSSNKNRKNSAIEYEVSGSEVMTNGDSFDSIHSAEEVYADNSPPLQRSHQSSRLSDSNDDENAQNDLNERRNSQTELNSNEQTSEMQTSSQRNTITPILSESKQNSESNEVLNDSSQSSFRDSNKSPRNYVTCRERRQIAQSSRSARSSNSSLNSNNSENRHSPDCDNSPVNRQSYANDHNYINEQLSNQNAAEDNCIRDRGLRTQTISTGIERAPEWVPDIAAPDCMRCGVHFTAFRRRHHCRNCGKVFCASCSANSIPLPRFGQLKPVRVCEECFQLLAKKACASRQINSNSARQTSYTHR